MIIFKNETDIYFLFDWTELPATSQCPENPVEIQVE